MSSTDVRDSDDDVDVTSSEEEEDDDDGSALTSSALGTKDYWDSTYAKELDNFAEIGDEGTVWFGEDAVRRVGKWLNTRNFDKEKSLVLDLGSGNGSMLLSLATSGWRRLTGVDYSTGAVQLAASIARRKVEDGWLKDYQVEELVGNEGDVDQLSSDNNSTMIERLSAAAPSHDVFRTPYIAFAVFDITDSTLHTSCPSSSSSSSSSPALPRFDVILDKGTFDAISLCPDDAETKKRRYAEFVKRVLKDADDGGGGGGGGGGDGDRGGGVFSITSCNWTEEELMKTFGVDFELKDRVPFPSFQFGGKSGSTVTSLILTRKSASS